MTMRILILAIMFSSSLYGCTTNKEEFAPQRPIEKPGAGGGEQNPDIPSQTTSKMIVTIAKTTFTATLEDNRAVTAFKAMLPLTLEMNEMNNNEKYASLPNSLPTLSSNRGTIHSGDIMLYGSNTLVLFYKTFSTSYGYTPIAKIDVPSGLASALGSGDVMVKFKSE